MQLNGVKPGDIVRVDKKGRVFYAVVEDKEKGKLRIAPTINVMYFEASAREVTGHWRKAKGGLSRAGD